MKKKILASGAIVVALTAPSMQAANAMPAPDSAAAVAASALVASAPTAGSGDDARRKCISMKKTKKMRLYISLKKAQKLAGWKGKKVGTDGDGYKSRSWRACYSDYSSVLVTTKKGKVYALSGPTGHIR